MNVILVDDEQLARATLRSFIEQYCEDVHIVGEAANVPEAIKVIMKTQPDVVFLDIEMPGFSGLQLPDFFEEGELNFHIIFTTAYAQYAVQAFRLSAIDYLLKPIDIQQLQEAVKRVKELYKNPQVTAEKLTMVQNSLEGQLPERIALPTGDGMELVLLEEISFIQADGSYSCVHFSNKKQLLVSKKLGEFDLLLESDQFFKPHRSFMINMNEVQKYVKSDGGYIVMNTGAQVPLSKSRKQDFLDRISTLL